jgi:hypothetical protein
MTKEQLKEIIDKYISAEAEVMDLDSKFGIQIWNSRNENFYNRFNFVIFKLFEHIFTPEGIALLEDYIFEQTNITYDELWDTLSNLKKI